MKAIQGIEDVAEGHLCTGCGACAYVQPNAIRMVDDFDHGRRPMVEPGASTEEAVSACPGAHLGHGPDAPGVIAELRDGWGPVLSLWEGFANDDEVRWLASSGGAATALALHGLEQEGMAGVLHITSREDVPYLNRTVLSTTRSELLGATGSRYAPASPCDGLSRIEDAAGPCVFIGKPCDVAWARLSASIRPGLDAKLGLTIAVFCAGTPSTRGTIEFAKTLGFENPTSIRGVRYRGKGWPGMMEIEGCSETGEPRPTARVTYSSSWGFLQRYRQWRCYVCADHTGEFADISVGDPWYRDIPEGEPGRSLVLARTARGEAFLQRAVAAGALHLERVPPSTLVASQPNLLHTRGAVWARVLALKLLGVRAPTYVGLPTFRIWLRDLTFKQRTQAFYGTLKRVFTKRLRERAVVRPWVPDENERAGDS